MQSTPEQDDSIKELDRSAYAAFDGGHLDLAVDSFRRLIEANPGNSAYEYMLGLSHKYRREWRECIEHNMRAIAKSSPGEELESNRWNIAIAASAIGEWSVAREHWIAAGLELEQGDAPLDDESGTVCVRLNAWSTGETLFATRIGIARARLRNIPLPDSGYRFGDLVLIDGACTGRRQYGQGTVSVFNGLQRLTPSEFATFDVRVDCASAADAEALESSEGDGIGLVEDWSRSMQLICRACSYGEPHEHAEREPDANGWVRERRMGVAATSLTAVEELLDRWVAAGQVGSFLQRLARRRPRRAVLEIDDTQYPEQPVCDCGNWWSSHEPEDAPASDDASEAPA